MKHGFISLKCDEYLSKKILIKCWNKYKLENVKIKAQSGVLLKCFQMFQMLPHILIVKDTQEEKENY